MNRAWITGLTVASVAGTGGVAFATMNAGTHGDTATVTPQAAETTATAAAQQYSFQAGAAGQVNLTAAEGELRVDSVLPTAGWSVLGTSGTGTHVELQLTDTLQVITFSADLVDGQVQAGITATPVPTVPAPTDPATTGTPATPAPAPATPVVVLTPSVQTPAPSHTSAPSGSGSHEDDDDHEGHDDDGGSDD